MGIKISDLSAKASKISSTDLLEVSVVSGTDYVSRSITGAEINELSLDTSPQLGGNLDVNGHTITSDSDQDVIISPNGVGSTKIESNLNLRDTAGSTAPQVNFYEGFSNGSHYIGIKAPNSLSSDTTYTLPTADGTSGQVLQTNGSGTLSWATAGGGGITVGTTAVTSGTVGRVFFEGTGNVVQQSASLFWDNTNARLGVGATPSTSVRLDVRAQGALTTDLAFRIRNSANSLDLGYINGVGDIVLGSGSSVTIGSGGNGTVVSIGESAAVNSGFSGYPIAIGKSSASNGSGIAIGNGASVGGAATATVNHNIAIGTSATTSNTVSKCIVIGQSTTTGLTDRTIAIGSDINFGGYTGRYSIALGFNFTGGNFINHAYAIGNATTTGATLDIGDSFSVYINRTTRSFFVNQNSNLVFRTNNTLTSGTHFDANATNTLTLHSGTAPASNIVDAAQQYTADVVAGNAAPHFRTENGDVVKLYRVGGWGLPTGTFTRTTFDTATVTTAQLAERVAALIQDLRDNHQLLKA